jgi:hypothetical protein
MRALGRQGQRPMQTGNAADTRRCRLAPLGIVAALALGALLAGCTQSSGDEAATGVYRLFNSTRNPAIETLQHSSQLVVVPPGRALVHVPQALIVLERNMGVALEQQLILPNGSAVRGDNVLHVRAQTSTSARLTEFNFADISARLGGMPAPFERANLGGLLSGSDSLGSYVYARENIGVDTVCVLVLRRMNAAARPLPRGVQALDIILRNCVVGTVEQALSPLSDRTLAHAAAPQDTVYNLSPFAAPSR